MAKLYVFYKLPDDILENTIMMKYCSDCLKKDPSLKASNLIMGNGSESRLYMVVDQNSSGYKIEIAPLCVLCKKLTTQRNRLERDDMDHVIKMFSR